MGALGVVLEKIFDKAGLRYVGFRTLRVAQWEGAAGGQQQLFCTDPLARLLPLLSVQMRY